MLPDKAHPRWRELVTGEFKHRFSLVSGGMCVSRNNRRVMKKIETNPEVVQAAIDSIYTFFTKYESILEDDIKAIFR